MRTKDIAVGTVVKTKTGTIGQITVGRKEVTHKKGRPTTFFTVEGAEGEFRAKDLRKPRQTA